MDKKNKGKVIYTQVSWAVFIVFIFIALMVLGLFSSNYIVNNSTMSKSTTNETLAFSTWGFLLGFVLVTAIFGQNGFFIIRLYENGISIVNSQIENGDKKSSLKMNDVFRFIFPIRRKYIPYSTIERVEKNRITRGSMYHRSVFGKPEVKLWNFFYIYTKNGMRHLICYIHASDHEKQDLYYFMKQLLGKQVPFLDASHLSRKKYRKELNESLYQHLPSSCFSFNLSYQFANNFSTLQKEINENLRTELTDLFQEASNDINGLEKIHTWKKQLALFLLFLFCLFPSSYLLLGLLHPAVLLLVTSFFSYVCLRYITTIERDVKVLAWDIIQRIVLNEIESEQSILPESFLSQSNKLRKLVESEKEMRTKKFPLK